MTVSKSMTMTMTMNMTMTMTKSKSMSMNMSKSESNRPSDCWLLRMQSKTQHIAIEIIWSPMLIFNMKIKIFYSIFCYILV